jgi:uncharacterized protein YggE
VRPALLALVLLAALAPVAIAQEPDPDQPDPDAPAETEPPPSVEVVGQAALTARNDAARVVIGMTSRRSTQDGALAASARKQRKVIARLRAAGVQATDIDVLTVRLTRFHFNGRVTRVVARNGIRLTIRKLRRVRGLVAAARSAGATAATRPAFFLSDPEALYQRALLAAFDDAEQKAETLAERADETLGLPISMHEGAPGRPVAVDARTSRVEATLTVEFELEEF